MRAGIEDSGGGGQAKIAMSRQRRGLRGRTDGQAGTSDPAAERRDGLVPLMRSDINHTVLSANYTMPAFTPQPQSITAFWLVLILPSHGG